MTSSCTPASPARWMRSSSDGNQRLATFERETLLADEARIEIALDALGPRQAVEDRRLLCRRERPMDAGRLELLAKPEPLAGPRHVRELGSELAAVDLLQQRQDVLELHARVAGAGQPARRKLARQVRFVETEEIEAQHGRRGPLPHAERIEIGDLMAAQAVDLDQARDGRLLLDGRRGFRRRCRRRSCALRLPQALRYGLNDRAVRNFGVACREGAEVLAPLRRNAARLGEVLLIEPLDVGRVGSLQVRRIVLMLEYCAHELGRGGVCAYDYAAPEPEGARSVAKQALSSNAVTSQERTQQPPFVGDQCDVRHKNALEDDADAHDAEQPRPRHGDEHEHAGARQAPS